MPCLTTISPLASVQLGPNSEQEGREAALLEPVESDLRDGSKQIQCQTGAEWKGKHWIKSLAPFHCLY